MTCDCDEVFDHSTRVTWGVYAAVSDRVAERDIAEPGHIINAVYQTAIVPVFHPIKHRMQHRRFYAPA